MTVRLASSAFDIGTAHRLRMDPPCKADRRGRAFAVAVTVAMHVGVAAGLVMGMHVASLKVLPALTVRISPAQPKLAQDATLPPPQLQKPRAVIVPPPEFTVQAAPSPVIVQLATPVPPPPKMAPQKSAGEGKANFLGRLLAQLNRFKQYPRAARQAHIEGVGMLHFVMDADGKVLSAEIAKSSGRPVLDSEALALIQRARPLPALPADFPTRTLDAVVPIEFSLDG
jgi:TonB family protein